MTEMWDNNVAYKSMHFCTHSLYNTAAALRMIGTSHCIRVVRAEGVGEGGGGRILPS